MWEILSWYSLSSEVILSRSFSIRKPSLRPGTSNWVLWTYTLINRVKPITVSSITFSFNTDRSHLPGCGAHERVSCGLHFICCHGSAGWPGRTSSNCLIISDSIASSCVCSRGRIPTASPTEALVGRGTWWATGYQLRCCIWTIAL